MAWYETRDAVLRRMHFKSYGDYLASKLWRTTRAKVLNRAKGRCEVCGRDDEPLQVHHRSYTLMAMLGKRLEFLVATCRGCHKGAEFENGRKVDPYHANRRMNAMAKEHGMRLVGLCVVCRKNPTKRGKTVCGRCVRDGRVAA